jgi:hypothetical protein
MNPVERGQSGNHDMRLTDDRINYLSHHIIRTLMREGMVKGDESLLTVEIKKAMIRFIKEEEAVDGRVRSKIATIKRGIPEHSREWDILYEKYYDEEMNKMK